MDFRRFGNKYVLRLDKGEEIVQSVTGFCREEGISLGQVSGIGAIGKLEIGYFQVSTKEYHTKILEGDMEILGLSGNISTMKGNNYIHFHIVVSDENLNAFGGHLNLAVISATGEIIIDVIEGSIDREFDEEIGLNLIKF